jgi:hypothetical protein
MSEDQPGWLARQAQSARYTSENEQKPQKILIGVCALLSLTISATFAGLYWDRMFIAYDYDSAVQLVVPAMEHQSAYDTCPGADISELNIEAPDESTDIEFTEYEEEDINNHPQQNLYNRFIGVYSGGIEGGKKFVGVIDTHWTVVFQFNAIFNTILAIQSFCLLMGVFVVPIRIVTSYIHVLITGFIHIAMVITTGVYRYDVYGRACSLSDTQTSKHTTFGEDGEFI